MQYNILVVLEKSQKNYSAYAPDVPGCIATGKTIEEVLLLMQEALQEHIGLTVEEGYEIPEISAVEAHFVRVDIPEKQGNPRRRGVTPTRVRRSDSERAAG
jgi:predicted RNase H-like HicB family nuclease